MLFLALPMIVCLGSAPNCTFQQGTLTCQVSRRQDKFLCRAGRAVCRYRWRNDNAYKERCTVVKNAPDS